MIAVQPFLTAYDPSDLPGSSVDPLGFERGYLHLAEKILPGLTNVASRPRYFSALCAAILISDERKRDGAAESPRARYARRLEAVQRFERFWALGCLLASEAHEGLDSTGIRGLRYVQAAARRMQERGDSSTSGDFKLLSRQMTYGMVGIYGSVADGLRFIMRDTLTLGPDIGRRVAEAFVKETELPGSLRSAIAEGGDVGLTSLRAWGQRAHLHTRPQKEEAKALRDALQTNATRARMAELLHQHQSDGDTELPRLRRIAQSLAPAGEDAHIYEALRAIAAYEACYRLVLLVFFRLLWFCQSQEPFAVELSTAGADPVVTEAHARLRDARAELEASLDAASTPAFCTDLVRLRDARLYLGGAASASSPLALVESVLSRHRDVQRAKVDGGRPKMPWVEVNRGKVVPTLSVAQRVGSEPKLVTDVAPHPYRTFAADQLYQAGVES